MTSAHVQALSWVIDQKVLPLRGREGPCFSRTVCDSSRWMRRGGHCLKRIATVRFKDGLVEALRFSGLEPKTQTGLTFFKKPHFAAILNHVPTVSGADRGGTAKPVQFRNPGNKEPPVLLIQSSRSDVLTLRNSNYCIILQLSAERCRYTCCQTDARRKI
jgi:hypothetical protein